jgi:hypothetical protein
VSLAASALLQSVLPEQVANHVDHDSNDEFHRSPSFTVKCVYCDNNVRYRFWRDSLFDGVLSPDSFLAPGCHHSLEGFDVLTAITGFPCFLLGFAE